jgi:hypothetical protein
MDKEKCSLTLRRQSKPLLAAPKGLYEEVVMQNAYIVTGSVTDEQTLHLDEALPVKAARVRVVVEVLEAPPKLPYAEFIAWLRQRQDERGHVPLTREEVDAYLNAERDSWDR